MGIRRELKIIEKKEVRGKGVEKELRGLKDMRLFYLVYFLILLVIWFVEFCLSFCVVVSRFGGGFLLFRKIELVGVDVGLNVSYEVGVVGIMEVFNYYVFSLFFFVGFLVGLVVR